MTKPLKHVSYDPDEWWIAPIEPTREMRKQGVHFATSDPEAQARNVYLAMLSAAPTPPQWQPDEAMVRRVALAICKSRTCEGASCCQWPANMDRLKCNAKAGAYDDAARAALAAITEVKHDDNTGT